jgi:hypothetical protein
MAYRVPTFNIKCNIWHNPWPVPGSPGMRPPDLGNVECQLTYGRRMQLIQTQATADIEEYTLGMNLLLPKRTDVRGPNGPSGGDLVEVPAGTGRYYLVYGVDDVGRGFSNEYRTAGIQCKAGSWPEPYP